MLRESPPLISSAFVNALDINHETAPLQLPRPWNVTLHVPGYQRSVTFQTKPHIRISHVRETYVPVPLDDPVHKQKQRVVPAHLLIRITRNLSAVARSVRHATHAPIPAIHVTVIERYQHSLR